MNHRRFFWLLVVPTFLFVALIWFDVVPSLRGPDEWRWSLRQSDRPVQFAIIPIVGVLLYAIAAASWTRTFDTSSTRSKWRAREYGWLVLLTLAAPLIQILLASAVWRTPAFEFFANTTSPSVTGFYNVAVDLPNLPSRLTNYTTLLPTMPIHPSTHPPGLVLIQWLGWQLFQGLPNVARAVAPLLRDLQCQNVALMTLNDSQIASASIGMLLPFIGGLTVWPMYALGRRLVNPKVAAIATAIFPVLPMFAMWPSQWDQVYPLLLCVGLYFIQTGLESASIARVFTGGVSLSLATFLSIGNAVLIMIVGLYGALQSVKHRQPHWLRLTMAFVLGCLMIWLWYVVAYQVKLTDLATFITRLLSESTRCPTCPSTNRSYGVWLIWNPIDFGIFLSIPLTLLLLHRLIKAIPQFRQILQHDLRDWQLLAIATGLPLLILVVSGIVRGEVSRMWAYFSPLLVLIAMAAISGDTGMIGRSRNVAILIGLIGLQLTVMNTRWQPYPSFMNEPPLRQVDFAAPQAEFSLDNVVFGRRAKLLSFDTVRQGSTLTVTLFWQSLSEFRRDFTVFVHVLNGDGQLIALQDNMPVSNLLPTACWQTGEVVQDAYTIQLPTRFNGDYSITVGLYRIDTGQRMRLANSTDTEIEIYNTLD